MNDLFFRDVIEQRLPSVRKSLYRSIPSWSMTNDSWSRDHAHARLRSSCKASLSLMHLEHHHALKLGRLRLPPCAGCQAPANIQNAESCPARVVVCVRKAF